MSESTIPEEEIREAWNAQADPLSFRHSKDQWNEAVIVCGPARGGLEQLTQIFRLGYLAHAANHAEEVAKKDAEIEELKGVLQEAIWHGTTETIKLNDAEFALTAAREREEKVATILKKIAEMDKLRGFPDQFHAFYVFRAEYRTALEFYESSRAADGKEGA